MIRAFLVAGESSGDALGGALMAGLKARVPDIAFAGIGGAEMQAHGLTSLFPMEELSVMGLAEVLPRYRQLRRRLHQTAETVLAARPDVLITIDSPDFGLRVASRVRTADPSIRTVHYVAPTVWAWRPGRAANMASAVDQVLALLPFEPPYMEAAGMRCDFVGHPVATMPQASAAERAAFRQARLGADGGPLVLVLPGSRRAEVDRLGPRFGAALARLAQTHPRLKAVLPVAPSVAERVRKLVAGWSVAVEILPPATQASEGGALRRAAFGAADVALAASGTVSLELAAARTPMVIGYDMAWLTLQIMKRMVRVDAITMVNLVSGTRTIPEFIGPACHPEALADALAQTLGDPAPQRAVMDDVMAQLGAGGLPPGERAAEAVLDGLARARAGQAAARACAPRHIQPPPRTRALSPA